MSDEEIKEEINGAVKKGKWDGVADRILDSLDIVVAKITSGKFLAITFDTVGYFCGVMIAGWLAIKELIEPATFVAILASYSLLIQKTRERYFDINRNPADKPSENGGKQ